MRQTIESSFVNLLFCTHYNLPDCSVTTRYCWTAAYIICKFDIDIGYAFELNLKFIMTSAHVWPLEKTPKATENIEKSHTYETLESISRPVALTSRFIGLLVFSPTNCGALFRLLICASKVAIQGCARVFIPGYFCPRGWKLGQFIKMNIHNLKEGADDIRGTLGVFFIIASPTKAYIGKVYSLTALLLAITRQDDGPRMWRKRGWEGKVEDVSHHHYPLTLP